MNYKIEKIELIAISLMVLLGLVWTILIIPFLENSSWFVSLSPVYAYWLFNFGWIMIFSGTVGIPIGFFVSRRIDVIDSIKGGLSSFILFSWIYDTWQGGFYLDSTGKVLIPLGTTSLENTAVDAFWGEFWKLFGFSGNLLYLLTYPAVTIIALIVISLLLKPKEFLSVIGVNSPGNFENEPRIHNKLIFSGVAIALVIILLFSFNIVKLPSFMVVPEITSFEVEGCNTKQIPCHIDHTTNQLICPDSFTYKTEQTFDLKCPTKPDNYKLDCMPGNVKLMQQETACWVSFTSFNCLKPSGILGFIVSGSGDMSAVKLRLNGQDLGYLTYNALYRTWDIPFDYRQFDWKCSLQPSDVNCYTTEVPNSANKIEIINDGLNEVEIYSVKARIGLETFFVCDGEMCSPLRQTVGCSE